DFVTADCGVDERTVGPAQAIEYDLRDLAAEPGVEPHLDSSSLECSEDLRRPANFPHGRVGLIKPNGAGNETAVDLADSRGQFIAERRLVNQHAKGFRLRYPHDPVHIGEGDGHAHGLELGLNAPTYRILIVDRGSGHIEDNELDGHALFSVKECKSV